MTSRLFAEPKTFSQVQILRLLSFLNARSPDECQSWLEKHVFIRSWLSLAFPSTEIINLEKEEQQHFVITATRGGLYSTLGPLPTLYTEELIEEERNDEHVSRDFLDILNNRLSQLAYQADLQHKLVRRTIEQENTRTQLLLFSLMGEAERSLRVPGLPRVSLMELLSRLTRSASDCSFYLSLVLGRNDVRIEQCVERRTMIPEEQRLKLGAANNVLGVDSMLGVSLRDSTALFRIHFDRVLRDDIRSFLPGQAGYSLLQKAIRRFLETPLEYELVLHPVCADEETERLGTTTGMGFFLGSQEYAASVRVF